MPKLTIINQQYPPEVAATGQIFRAMAEYMQREGFDVTVVTGTPYYPGGSRKAKRSEVMNGVRVRRLWNTSFSKKSFIGKLLNLATFQASLFFYCVFRISREHTALVATAPPLAVLCAAAGRRVRGFRMILTVQDLYPDVLAASGMSDPARVSYRFLKKLMRSAMRACDRVVTISTDMRAHLISEYGLPRVELIPNLFPESIRAVDNTQLKAEMGLSGKLIVQYSGNFGVAHEYHTLLTAIRSLGEQNGDVVFQVAGGGKNYDALRAACEADRLNNVFFEGYAPADKLEQRLCTADISVVVLSDSFRDVLLPSKYYGILASGRGVLLISGCDSDISRDIAEHGIGAVFGHGEGEQMADMLRMLMQSPQMLREMGENARALYENKYTQKTILNAYRALFMEE